MISNILKEQSVNLSAMITSKAITREFVKSAMNMNTSTCLTAYACQLVSRIATTTVFNTAINWAAQIVQQQHLVFVQNSARSQEQTIQEYALIFVWDT